METSEIIDIYATSCLVTDSSDMSNCSNSNLDVGSMESIAANVTLFTTEYQEDIKYNSSFTTNDSDKSSSKFSPLGSPDIMSLNYITEKINDLERQLNQEKNNNAILKEDLHQVKKKLNTFQKYQNDNYKDVEYLFEQVYSMDVRLSECDQYTRRSNLVISGIPDNVDQKNLEYEVLKIIKSIGIFNVTSYQIVACHRLRKNINDKYPARTIVRFTNRKIVESCLYRGERLKQMKQQLKMNIRFFENLSNSNEKILKECQNLFNQQWIHSYIIRNGFLKIRIKEDDNPIKIIHQDVLDNLFPEYYDYNI